VATNLASPFQPYVVEKFLGALQRTGRQALVFTTPPDQEMDDILPLVLQYQVDGLIITSATLSSARLDAYAREGTPIILFNRSMPGEDITTVCCDNVQGARMAADRLVDAGHHHFACIVGNLNWSTARDRERGFMERLAERGAPPPLARHPDRVAGRQRVRRAGGLSGCVREQHRYRYRDDQFVSPSERQSDADQHDARDVYRSLLVRFGSAQFGSARNVGVLPRQPERGSRQRLRWLDVRSQRG